MKTEKIIIGYHANCPDGTAAAMVAWRHFNGRGIYCALDYSEKELHPALRGAHPEAEVYLLDFHYGPEILASLAQRVKKVVVMDHHKTFHQQVTDWELLHGELPIERWGESCTLAGCILAWAYWDEGELPPRLLSYVQDRDLWHWELPHSRAVSAWLGTVSPDFAGWAQIMDRIEDESYFLEVIQTGAAILAHVDKVVRGQARSARLGILGGVDAVIVNATAFHSELGHHLLEVTPEAQVAAIYRETEEGARVWSLRSRPDFDCSRVAKAYGGGGHPQACGFTERPVVVYV